MSAQYSGPLHRPDVATPGPSSPGEESTSKPEQWSVVVIHCFPLFPPRGPVDQVSFTQDLKVDFITDFAGEHEPAIWCL